jgi:hypothetical protein
MLRLFNRLIGRQSDDERDVTPLDRLLSMMLASAHHANATAMILGMPRGARLADWEKCVAEFEAAIVPAMTAAMAAGPPFDQNEATRASDASTSVKSAAGWQTIPVWLKIDGQLHPTPGPPMKMFLPLLALIENRLVSLNATADSPQPVRYIEHYSETAGERRFTEVELSLGDDNTFQIELLKCVKMPLSVRTSRYVTA